MANCYDNTCCWSPFPAPATSLIWPHPHAASCMFSSSPAAAAAFENDALASALLRASMMPPPPSSPTPSSSTATTSSASELSSVHHHDAPAPAPHGSAANNKVEPRRSCKGRGGVSKRKPKPRASRRAPTTYISACPADFRRMVQEITGLAVPGPAGAAGAACPVVASTSWPQDVQLAFVLPTLDTSASFMLDRAPLQRWGEDKDKASSDGAATAMAATAREETVPEDYPSLLLMRELEAMVGAPAAASSSSFPTFESWGMI